MSDIKYVSFNCEISVGGDLGAITSWSRDKHGAKLELIEQPGGIIIVCEDKTVREIPSTSVNYIARTSMRPPRTEGKK